MKISMTNSDRGLGKVISDRFDDVVEGFDEDSDVFINNRHYYFSGQAKLLMEVFEKWRYEKKTIVNIISRSKYPNISKGYLYSASKASVSHLSNNLRLTTDKECRIIDINPGLLNSDLPLDLFRNYRHHCLYNQTSISHRGRGVVGLATPLIKKYQR